MDIIKKNILSVIAGLVAILALVAWVYPFGRIKLDAETKLAERTKVYNSMQSLLNNSSRTMPIVSLQGTEAQPLGMFPTEKVIAWGDELTAKLAREAKGVRDVAIALNQRPLLVPNTLPSPAPTSEFRFRDVYIRYVSDFVKLVKAGTPPTAADITQAQQELWKTKYEPQITIRNGQPDQTSQQQVTAEFQKEAADLPDAVKVARARSILFYMDPQAMDVNTQIASATGSAPTAVMIWDAQVKIWIQNDVAQAIINLNSRMSAMHCVIDAPFKQLLKLQIGSFRGAGAVSAGPAVGGMPPGMGGIVGGPGGPPPEILALMAGGPRGMGGGGGMTSGAAPGESFTGRGANAMYDVVPFTITAHVEAARLPDFLEELGRDRFVTPYQVSSIKAIDSLALSVQSNVMYGSAPVVEVVVGCEALLLRDWTVPLMPQEIRASLGVDNGGAGAATGAPVGVPAGGPMGGPVGGPIGGPGR